MILTSEPTTWDGLLTELLAADTSRWLFRGQENFDWKLATRLERDLARWPGISDESARQSAEVEAINTFVSKARHLVTEIPGNDLLGWLSVMQHYGAPTRLLDWTRSPFVACYFAFSGAGGGDAALWLLNEQACRLAHGNVDFSTTSGFVFYSNGKGQASISHTDESWIRQQRCMEHASLNEEQWPLVVVPAVADERIRAQQGMFTFHGALNALAGACPTKELWRAPAASTQLEDGASGVRHDPQGVSPLAAEVATTPLPAMIANRIYWNDTIKGHPEAVIKKVRLKGAWKRDAIRMLQGMNITPDVLFPGLDGIGRAATLQVQCGDAIGRVLSHRAFVAAITRGTPGRG